MFRRIWAWLFKKRSKHRTTLNVEARDVICSPITVSHRDQKDVELIQSQQSTIDAQQATIDRLLGQHPGKVDEQTRDIIADAVTGLPQIDSDSSDIKRAEQALANGKIELASALYRTDAEKKRIQGYKQLQAAAASYRRLGALAYLVDTSQAIEAYKEAVSLWPEDIEAWNQIGLLYLRMGKFPDALDSFGKLIELACTNSQNKYLAWGYGNQGNVYLNAGQLDQAYKNFENARIFEEKRLTSASGEEERNDALAGVARCEGSLANIKLAEKDFLGSIQHSEKALKIYKELNDQFGIANQLGRLGSAKIYSDPPKAESLLKESVTCFESLNAIEGAIPYITNLIIIYRNKGQSELALKECQRVLDIVETLDNKPGIAAAHAHFGTVYAAIERHEDALTHLAISLDHFFELGILHKIADQLANLGSTHYKKNEIIKACDLWKGAILYYETCNGQETNIRQVSKLLKKNCPV